MVFNDFRSTNRCKITQKSRNTRSKTWLVFGIDFGCFFFNFELQNDSKIDPKSTQNREHEGTYIGTGGSWKRSGSKTIQNGPKVSKSTPKTTPQARKTTPKGPPEFQKQPLNESQSFRTHPKRALELWKSILTSSAKKISQNIFWLSPYFVLCSFHFALFTLHFHLHSIQPGGLREAIK